MLNKFEELEKLAQIKEQWIISNDEFEEEKKKILNNKELITNKIDNTPKVEQWFFDIVYLKNTITWKIKECPTWFSWTSLIFWFWVPLFRWDFLWFFLHIILTFITFYIFPFIFPFFYNSIFIRNYLKNWYLPYDINSKDYLKRNWYII